MRGARAHPGSKRGRITVVTAAALLTRGALLYCVLAPQLMGIETGFGAVIATFPGGLPNVVLATLLALSCIPYFLPEDLVPAAWK